MVDCLPLRIISETVSKYAFKPKHFSWHNFHRTAYVFPTRIVILPSSSVSPVATGAVLMNWRSISSSLFSANESSYKRRRSSLPTGPSNFALGRQKTGWKIGATRNDEVTRRMFSRRSMTFAVFLLFCCWLSIAGKIEFCCLLIFLDDKRSLGKQCHYEISNRLVRPTSCQTCFGKQIHK